MIAGSLSVSVSDPPSTSRVTVTLSALSSTFEANVAWPDAEQPRQHLAGLVVVVVDRLLAEDDEVGLFLLDDLGEQLGDAERLDLVFRDDQDRAVGAHRERGAQRFLRLLLADRDDDDLGDAPASCSLRRIASSTAISSNGFMLILTFARSTPVPSAFTRGFTL